MEIGKSNRSEIDHNYNQKVKWISHCQKSQRGLVKAVEEANKRGISYGNYMAQVKDGLISR